MLIRRPMNVAAGFSTVRGLGRFAKMLASGLMIVTSALAGCSAPVEGAQTSQSNLDETNGGVDACTAAAPSSVQLDVPWISQNPELPRGCEVTSLSMVLRHAGVDADKLVLAGQVEKVPYTTNDLHGNPYDGFVGDMYTFSKPGLGVYHGPVARLAERYLPGRVLDLTGGDFDDILAQQIGKKRPVWIITNATFKKLPASQFETWKTSSGDLAITWHEHSVVITGYDPNYVYINDPLDARKNKKLPREDFREAWEQMGRQAISYETCGFPVASPGGACEVRASSGRLYCDNRGGAALYASTDTNSAIVDHLRTSYSWFDCWAPGSLHAGGNTTWYQTIGDDHGARGWVPAVSMHTPDALDADPSALGLKRCDVPAPTPAQPE